MVEESFVLKQVNAMPADLLDEMLMLIKNSIPAKSATHELMSRAKFILTELITNAIKHANSDHTQLKIEIEDKWVRFIKTDASNPFVIPTTVNKLFKNASIITTDVMHTLYAVKINNKLQFYCYENPAPEFDIDTDLPEHFGLLIITKASDEFYYEYKAESNLNKFAASIKL